MARAAPTSSKKNPFASLVFAALASGNSYVAQAGFLVATLGHSLYNASLGAWLVTVFDAKARGTILGVAWNTAAALIGGTSPAVCVELIRLTGSDVAPGFYISLLAAVALAGMHHLRTEEEGAA